jgi:tyrosyl-tRNA synthetase
LDGEKIEDITTTIKLKKESILRVGKRKFIKIISY